MNPTPCTPAHPTTPIFDFDARFLTAIIPVRWRAAVLVLGTVTLFPLIITIFMVDAVTHDMPSLRAPFKRVFSAISHWFRDPHLGREPDGLAFPDLVDPQSSLRSSTV